MIRILTVLGTRPEAIKMAPLILRLAGDPRFESRLCVTGQHREMLDAALSAFDLRPDFDLHIMKPGQQLADIASATLTGLGSVLDAFKPDRVLVQGDTTTTLAAAIAAFYRRIRVGHVEAGLRTGDLGAPFPEEGNRKLTTGISDLHFAPTVTSRQNLLNEGVPADRIFVTGNTVIDALLMMRERLTRGSGLYAMRWMRGTPGCARIRAWSWSPVIGARTSALASRTFAMPWRNSRPGSQIARSSTPCISTRTCESPCTASLATSRTYASTSQPTINRSCT